MDSVVADDIDRMLSLNQGPACWQVSCATQQPPRLLSRFYVLSRDSVRKKSQSHRPRTEAPVACSLLFVMRYFSSLKTKYTPRVSRTRISFKLASMALSRLARPGTCAYAFVRYASWFPCHCSSWA